MMYVKYLTKCLASSKHSTNGRIVHTVIIVVVQHQCVCQPVWGSIKVVKAIGPGTESRVSRGSSNPILTGSHT